MTTITIDSVAEQLTRDLVRPEGERRDVTGWQRCARAECDVTFEPKEGKTWCSDKCGSTVREARREARKAAELVHAQSDLAVFEQNQEGEFETLAAAKHFVNEHADEGVACPACGQHVQRYARTMRPTAIAVMLAAISRSPFAPFHEPTLERELGITSGGDWARLRYWGLIEESVDPRTAAWANPTRRGWWLVTDLGIEFARGAELLPKHAIVFDGVCLRLDPSELVHVRDVIEEGGRFDYDDLLAGVAKSSIETRSDAEARRQIRGEAVKA